MFAILILTTYLLTGVSVTADTPANCMYEDIRGKWTFYIGEGGHDNTIDCTKPVDVVETTTLELKHPNIVVDEFGNEGHWTMIYNQGFEVIIHGRKFFAFSKFENNGTHSRSICNETLTGWTHDVFGRDWSCYYGVRKTSAYKKLHFTKNGVSEPWIHTEKYPKFDEMNTKLGRKRPIRSPPTAPVTENVRKLADQLPEEFDWRNHNGVNYITPVRHQRSCGSCYAFATIAMNEARLKIATGNKVNVILSPQDIIDCSPYSQGCHGGFAYLTAKYSEDFGMVEESCNNYMADKDNCNLRAKKNCTKYYFTYEYVGGYYGGCNEELMKIALVNNGPIAVQLDASRLDARYSSGQIYECKKVGVSFNPFYATDHVVAIIGYGTDKPSNTKYWIVKNSWGKNWGDEGFFRIKRGNNECGIESMASQSFPMF